jgi:uncharacterized protein (UPF0276 family)
VAFPQVGIGVTYIPALEPLLAIDGLVDVVEVEPQIFWAETGDPAHPYRCDPRVQSHLDALPHPKSVHSVGCAVGGSKAPHPARVALFAEAAQRLDPVVTSEHLSFDRAGAPGSEFWTRFFLPPLQSRDGASLAAANVAAVASRVGGDLAVETGVNYLAPQPGQLSDGAYVAAVVEEARCGILLDLHNVWTNEHNGRQSVRDFVAELPLDRVWELHVAGGQEHAGYWLDAHNGAVPDPVLDLLAAIVPELPCLRLATFEIVPEFVPSLGLPGLRQQIEAIRRACDGDRHRASFGVGGRGGQAGRSVVNVSPEALVGEAEPLPLTPEAWENALGGEVIGRTPEHPPVEAIRHDPGTALLRELVEEGRAGALAGALQLSIRLLLLSLGSAEVRRIMAGFWHEVPPEPFASTEALGFARYLRNHWPDVAYLDEVLSFETACIESLITSEPRSVTFRHDPAEVLGALADGRRPEAEER